MTNRLKTYLRIRPAETSLGPSTGGPSGLLTRKLCRWQAWVEMCEAGWDDRTIELMLDGPMPPAFRCGRYLIRIVEGTPWR